jgi:hypothetical protein
MMTVKVAGVRSLEQLLDFAASYLIDLGYVSHAGHEFALISPDSDTNVATIDDFLWFRDCVKTSLSAAGLADLIVLPDPINPTNEDVRSITRPVSALNAKRP